MANRPVNPLLRFTRRLATERAELTDVQLLERFTASHDESAFEALVRRHGRVIRSVCQRVLNNTHDADDAFQATFLVLIRKAESIREGQALESWLCGVAYRVALKAKAAKARRGVVDANLAESSGSATPSSLERQELREALDKDRPFAGEIPDAHRALLLRRQDVRRSRPATGWTAGTVSADYARSSSAAQTAHSPRHDMCLGGHCRGSIGSHGVTGCSRSIGRGHCPDRGAIRHRFAYRRHTHCGVSAS